MRLMGLLFSLFSIAIIFSVSSAWACPRIAGYPDVTCDGELTILALGDSVTFGRGDEVNNNQGGYPKRLRDYFYRRNPNVRIIQAAKPGASCLSIKARARSLIRNGLFGAGAADYAVVSCGLNDFFTHQDPAMTLATLKSIERLLRNRGTYAVLATLPTIRRDFQQPFVSAVNQLLPGAPIKFNVLNVDTEVSADNLHPNSNGHRRLFGIVRASLASVYRARAEKALGLRDSDGDGLFDKLEKPRFGTSSTKRDSDNDGLTDGEEVFTYYTDPLNRDTDGDGRFDGIEVLNNRDPLDPSDGAPVE